MVERADFREDHPIGVTDRPPQVEGPVGSLRDPPVEGAFGGAPNEMMQLAEIGYKRAQQKDRIFIVYFVAVVVFCKRVYYCSLPDSARRSIISGTVQRPGGAQVPRFQGAECEAVVRGASRSPRQRVKTHFLPLTLV